MPTQLRLFSIAALACCQVGVSGCASVAALAAAHPAAMAAAAEMLPVAAVMGGIGLLGVTGLVSHQGDTFEPGTLGALLNDRQVAVAALAGVAMQDQREVTIAAALEVDRGIVRARIALRDQLNRKPEAPGEEGKAALAAIDSAIAGLAQGAPAAVRQAGDRARVAADKLAVPAQVPQVRSFGPVYLFSFLPFQTMTVRGDFPERYPDGAVPRLTINGKSVAAYAYDAQSLAFSLPAGALGTPESQVPVWTRADLSIPWDAPRFDSFTRPGFESFVVVGLLPHSAGRVTIERRVTHLRIEEAKRTSDTYSLGVEAGEIDQSACLTLTPKDLADGWKIKPGSASLVLPSTTPTAFQDLGRQSQDERSVCWRVRLGTVASVDPSPAPAMLWSVSAVLRREVSEARTESESFDLSWGSSRVFNVPAGTWKVRYAKYGGAEVEFSGTDRSSPLFRVDSDARSIKVSAFPF